MLYNSFEIKKSNHNVDYVESIQFMQKRVDNILNKKEKELLWFLNHDHIYTCGTSSNKNEILTKTDVPIVKTNRGGKVTYHGPGQRIIYLMIDLNKRKKDIRKLIDVIEKSVILILKDLNVDSTSFIDRVGIWVTKVKGKPLFKEKKIGAIGLRIKKWVTYHGISFNLNPDLTYYNNIQACGLCDYTATSLQELGIDFSQEDFDRLFIDFFNKELKSF